MGIKFQRVKSHEVKINGETRTQYAVWVDDKHPPLTPITGTTRLVDEGRASKVSVPYIDTTMANVVEYQTVWVPLGQEGWTIKIQTTLVYKWDQYTSYQSTADGIYIWQSVDTGQILMVESNQCDANGVHDTSIPAFDRLEPFTVWYVDKIVIQSINGVQHMAQMELTLVRCWLS